MCYHNRPMRRDKQGMTIAAIFVCSFVSLACQAAAGTEMTITNDSEKAIPAGPMHWKPDQPLDTDQTYVLIDRSSKTEAQFDDQGRLWWWNQPMKAKQVINYTLQPAEARDRVVLEKKGEGKVEVLIDGKLFTAFNYEKETPKPYLYPVIGPTGDPVTRDYPMKDNPIEAKNGRQDHHHHRSIWTAHGEIKANHSQKEVTNYWHEAKDGSDQDRQEVAEIIRTVNGPVFGLLEARIDWVAATGETEFTEIRTYRLFAGNPDTRVIEAQNNFQFDQGDVTFLDTKEGGIMAIRLAVTMDEQGVKEPERLHGRMVNSQGGVGAGECWGKAAEWCDYVGPVDGETVGVAVLDHPENFGHPAHWHIRDYGLYTTNPFGLKNFIGKEHNGDHTWKKGDRETFRTRVILHKDETEKADIPGQWILYSDPPEVKITRQ